MAQFLGLNFPFKKGTQSFPKAATDAELIKQSLMQLILVAKGERVMRPDVGSNAYRFLFENNDDVLAELIRAEITSVIGKFEPRVALQAVTVTNDRDAGLVTVEIVYVIRATGQQDMLSVSIPTSAGA